MERWYYDACTLDSKDTYSQIVNKKTPPRESIISHLSLGEAFAGSHRKGKEASGTFAELIEALRDYIKIVGNDGIESELSVVRQQIGRISLTDAAHLATALKCGCIILRTSDQDLLGISKAKLREIAKILGKEVCTIHPV